MITIKENTLLKMKITSTNACDAKETSECFEKLIRSARRHLHFNGINGEKLKMND